MEKLMYVVWSKQDSGDAYREHFQAVLNSDLNQLGATNLRLTVVDAAVNKASKLRINNTLPPPDAVISFWLNSSVNRFEIENLLQQNSNKLSGFLVTESEPLLNTLHKPGVGERTYGMNQVVFLKKPQRLSFEEWIDIWHNSHTTIAIETQSTFGYRHNVVARKLIGDLQIDAIVEENFPPEAMDNPAVFYDAVGDEKLLEQRQQTMFESVKRFIDFDELDCLPMSEYNS